VTRLAPGGLAERSGLIRLGDTLVAISGASGRPRASFHQIPHAKFTFKFRAVS